VSQQKSAAWKRAHRAADVIDEARQLAVPRVSIRQAAKLAGMSDAWWAASVRGERKIAPGQSIDVVPPDDTLVRMARAVGVEQQVRELLDMPAASNESQAPAVNPRVAALVAELEDLLERLRAEVGPPPGPAPERQQDAG
jgi:hypothetical protein